MKEGINIFTAERGKLQSYTVSLQSRIKELEDALGWRSVGDGLPEKWGAYNVTDGKRRWEHFWELTNWHQDIQRKWQSITHWMPIPKLPPGQFGGGG